MRFIRNIWQIVWTNKMFCFQTTQPKKHLLLMSLSPVWYTKCPPVSLFASMSVLVNTNNHRKAWLCWLGTNSRNRWISYREGRPGAASRSHKVTRNGSPWQGRTPCFQNQAAALATSDIHSNKISRTCFLHTPAGPCSCLHLEQNKTKPFGWDFSKPPEEACDWEVAQVSLLLLKTTLLVCGIFCIKH